MTKEPGFLLEIDGEPVEFTGTYDDEPDQWWLNGNVYGVNEDTHVYHKVRNFLPAECLAFVNVYRVNPDGSRWGIQGVFRKGMWGVGKNNMPVWKVWDRLA